MLNYLFQLLLYSNSFKNISIKKYESSMNFIDETHNNSNYLAFPFDYTFASMSIINSTFYNNKGDDLNPGAIKLSGDQPVIIYNTLFLKNQGIYKGGAIYFELNDFQIIECSFIQNKCYNSNNSPSSGGAVYFKTSSNSNKFINSSIFEENSAKTSGGSIFIDNNKNSAFSKILNFEPQITIANCQFFGCTSEETGGSINFCHKDNEIGNNILIENCVFNSCSSNFGGSLFFHEENSNDLSGKVIVTNSNFINCRATDDGGALFSNSNFVNVNNCKFASCCINNENSGKGGSIFFNGTNELHIEMTNFDDCISILGGSIFASCDLIDIVCCNFTDCKSNKFGGSICIYGNCNNINFDDCFFLNCESNEGGSIYIKDDSSSSMLSITNCTFDFCTGSNFSCFFISMFLNSLFVRIM